MGRQKGSVGWWANHIYHRRSMEDIPTFSGWSAMEGFVKRAATIVIRGLIAITFLTGGRIMEVLDLREDQFDIRKNAIYVNAMIVLKQRQRYVYSLPWQDRTEYYCYDSIRKKDYRRVPIPKSESLTKYLIEYVELVRKRSEKLPSRIRRDEEGHLFPYKYGWAYKKITETDSSRWPHGLRVERASQLVIDYNYRVPELLRFFGWTSTEIATKYARLNVEDLLKKMARGEL